MSRFKYSLIVLLLFIVSCANIQGRYPSGEEPFDEIYGTTKNTTREVRYAYQGIMEVYNSLSDERKAAIHAQTLVDFSGDNALLPLPRVLLEDEYDQVAQGVDQRGRAIRAFLQDHYNGEKSYLSSGIVPEQVIERIINRSGEYRWAEFLDGDGFNFWYGPDVIRGPPEPGFPEGRFLIVEDNPGFIGGVGDLVKARESLLSNIPEYKKGLSSPDPHKFYRKLASEYKERAKKFGGVPVILQYTSSISADNEDKRVKSLFKDLGVQVVEVNTFKPRSDAKKRLVSGKDGVYLHEKQANGKVKKTKVGYVVGNMDPMDMDPRHPGNWPLFVKNEAEYHIEDPGLAKKHKKALLQLLEPDPETGKFDVEAVANYIRKKSNLAHDLDKKQGIPGLMDHFLNKKLGLTNQPGAEFIGDKEFYIYIEDFIRHYLGEEPIISNMETGSFRRFDPRGIPALDKVKFNKIFNNFDEYVVKGVDGRGGDAVWVGPKVDEATKEMLRKKIEADPGQYIFQKYNALSTLDDYIGDIRIISDVGPKGVTVANVPWARVVLISGDGKVNISANGFEAAVLIRKVMKAKSCNKLVNGLIKAK